MKTVFGIISDAKLKKIPPEWWRVSKDQKSMYLKVAIDENDIPDKYDNTHALRVVLPQGVDRNGRSTYLCNLKAYTPDDHNENFK